MKLSELSNLDANVCVSITLSDLREFLISVMAEVQGAKPAKEKLYLSTDEVAKELQVTKPTLWRWNKNCYLQPVKIGRKLLYRKSDVDALLEKEGA